MSRRSLRPQLNQIRGWVRQGRTDAWIAHQLDVTVQQIQAFKREQDLEADGSDPAAAEEVDLRAEDDAAIAAELEEEAKRRAEEEARQAEEEARKAEEAAAKAEEAEEDEDEEKPAKRARRTRGGRTRRRIADGPARGHLRPRRGGLRPVARPRRAGRPRLRRALGGPPPRRDHDRGGPDRDPPRRRRRGRRRGLTPTRARSPGATARTGSSATSSSRGSTAPPSAAPRTRASGTTTACASRGPTPARAPSDLAAAADRLQDGLRHRRIEIEDEAAGTRLRPGFERLGWKTTRLVWLALSEPPAGPDFEEVPIEVTRALRLEWARSEALEISESEFQRQADAEEDVARRRGVRALVERDEDGEPAGYALFLTDGETAEVEQAYVQPALRGRGTGGALVAAAARAGGGERDVHRRRRRGRSEAALPAARLPARVDPARVHAPAQAVLVDRQPAAAGEVARAAQVAAEGGVGDRADVPRVRDRRARPTRRGRSPSPCPARRGRRARPR